MPFFEDWLPGMAIGAAAVLIGPKALKLARPVVKAVVKAGLMVTDQAKEAFAEAKEEYNDLVAESRAELEQSEQPEAESTTTRKRKASAAASAG